jgi:hypothetical protein
MCKWISEVAEKCTKFHEHPVLVPMAATQLTKYRWFMARRSAVDIPIQVALTTIMCVSTLEYPCTQFYSLAAMVPVGCALFPQQSSIGTSTLKQYDTKAYKDLLHTYASEMNIPNKFYFNKGL